MKNYIRISVFFIIAVSLLFGACGGGGSNNGGDEDSVVTLADISGVTPPAYGETPVTLITETAEYTGIVTWSDSPITFAAETTYTATITLTAKSGYTLTGVAADFFKVANATTVSNTSDSGVVTAEFPATLTAPPTIINMETIDGVTAPVIGAARVTTVTETAQYTGIVAWDGDWTGTQTFAGSKAYTATVTLTAKSGYTLTGVTADFFEVNGATTVSNSDDSGVVTAVFPATETVSVGQSRLGGKVAYILQSGDQGFVAGEQRGLIAATADQDDLDGIVGTTWSVEAYQSTLVGGTDTILGTGSANTDKIIAQHGGSLVGYAAGLARAYDGGGYRDWYLPSQDELDKLYINNGSIGGFTYTVNIWYWSSSERVDGYVWIQRFYNGEKSYGVKYGYAERVRAVRSF